MSAREKQFTSIDGVPVYYDRTGRRFQQTQQTTNEFYAMLVAWKRDVQRASRAAGYGNISLIVTGGTFVNKGGQHGKGRAMDLDQIVWSGGKACKPIDADHASNSRAKRLRYLAIDAICRRHFRYVLDGWYNAAHRDHIHIDSATRVKLSKTSRSDTKFIQACCNEFVGSRLRTDGGWGPKTNAEFNKLMARRALRGLNPVGSVSDYKKFLGVIADFGLRNSTSLGTLAGPPSTPEPQAPPEVSTPPPVTSRVPSVATWQQLLRNIGFPISADGRVGRNTRQAVRFFQEAWTYEDLSVDGSMGPKTYAALKRCADNGGRISPNFKMAEMKSKGNGWPRMHRSMTRGLEKVRALKRKPLSLVSAHRDPAHNRTIPGAATNSQHTVGRAADISVRYGLTVAEAQSLRAFTGIGHQPNSNLVKHLDTRVVRGVSVTNPRVFKD